MESCKGAERVILKAVHDLSKGSITPVEDTEVASKTNISLEDVRTCLTMLQEKDYVAIIIVTKGMSAEITPKSH